MPILFYNTTDVPYGVFSNFASYGFFDKEIFYKTSEHYFQAQKYCYPDQSKHVQFWRIVHAETPKSAAALGRSRKYEIRSDWETIKEDVMYYALQRKFTSFPMLKKVLLSTGDEEIIEDSHVDSYWGCGKNGTGQNRLGILLMRLRQELRTY